MPIISIFCGLVFHTWSIKVRLKSNNDHLSKNFGLVVEYTGLIVYFKMLVLAIQITTKHVHLIRNEVITMFWD
jgi:hypothetical protein